MIETDWSAMKNLSDLTLVVPTYNRQKYALRQMHFWSDSPVTVYVLDGTSMPINNELLTGLGFNIHYYHMPCSYEMRFGKATKLINTPFVSLLCDDEFFIPSSLDHCINELNSHKDFIACAGRSLGFKSTKRGMLATSLYNKRKCHGFIGATAKERMLECMKPYIYLILYSVQRSEAWKKSMTIISKYDFSYYCPYLTELQFELTTCYQGKAMLIEELMWLRNLENDEINFDKFDRKILLDKWINNPNNATKLKFFHEYTSSELSKLDNADAEKVIIDIKLATKTYSMQRSVNSPKELLRNRLLDLIPKKAKRVLEQMNATCRWGQIINEAEKMQKERVTVNIQQLHEIMKFMEKEGD